MTEKPQNRCPCCEAKLALVKRVEGKLIRIIIPDAEWVLDD